LRQSAAAIHFNQRVVKIQQLLSINQSTEPRNAVECDCQSADELIHTFCIIQRTNQSCNVMQLNVPYLLYCRSRISIPIQFRSELWKRSPRQVNLKEEEEEKRKLNDGV